MKKTEASFAMTRLALGGASFTSAICRIQLDDVLPGDHARKTNADNKKTNNSSAPLPLGCVCSPAGVGASGDRVSVETYRVKVAIILLLGEDFSQRFDVTCLRGVVQRAAGKDHGWGGRQSEKGARCDRSRAPKRKKRKTSCGCWGKIGGRGFDERETVKEQRKKGLDRGHIQFRSVIVVVITTEHSPVRGWPISLVRPPNSACAVVSGNSERSDSPRKAARTGRKTLGARIIDMKLCAFIRG